MIDTHLHLWQLETGWYDWNTPQLAGHRLPYLAPEQSGRINREIDYRTDYYSFGATLYELLTGQPPFAGREGLELVHCHIARKPRPPHHINRLLQGNRTFMS